jgi:hypothetical protein
MPLAPPGVQIVVEKCHQILKLDKERYRDISPNHRRGHQRCLTAFNLVASRRHDSQIGEQRTIALDPALPDLLSDWSAQLSRASRCRGPPKCIGWDLHAAQEGAHDQSNDRPSGLYR